MLAERTCSRKEDSQEIDGPNQLIQETAESGNFVKTSIQGFWDFSLIYHDKLLTG